MKRRDFLKSSCKTVAGLGASALSLKSNVDAKDVSKSAKKKTNILFIFSDQHNANYLAKTGHPDVQTPNLDKLISEGICFNRAYCQDGVCVPSRTSMMTGKYPRTTGVLYNPDKPPKPGELKPLAEFLRINGYRTVAFGKRHLPRSLDFGFEYTCTTLFPKVESSNEYYWNWIKDQGQFEAFQRDWNAEAGFRLPGNQASEMACLISDLKPENTMEAYTAQKTIDFLKEAKNNDKPFFCWTSFYRPHQPYTPLKCYADIYNPDKITLPESLKEPVKNLPPAMRAWRNNPNKPWCLALAAKDINLYRRYIAYYNALVTEVDYHVGEIVKTLKAEGLDKNTIVIYASDHGDFVGAHGMIEKCHHGHNVYEDTLRVPLVISWPGNIQENKFCDDFVELVDIYPTLLDLAGLDMPDDYKLEGKSLVPTLKYGKPVDRKVVMSESWDMVTAISDRYKLGVWIRQPQGGFNDMLFDRFKDPLEVNNIIGQRQVASIENDLRKHLKYWTQKTEDNRYN